MCQDVDIVPVRLGGFYRCNIYDGEAKEGTLEGVAAAARKAAVELERDEHFVSRYLNSLRAAGEAQSGATLASVTKLVKTAQSLAETGAIASPAHVVRDDPLPGA